MAETWFDERSKNVVCMVQQTTVSCQNEYMLPKWQ